MTLHATETVALVEIWAGIKNYVPVKDQRACAEQYISTIDEAGLVDLTLSSRDMYGICAIFDSALRGYCEDNGLIEESYNDWEE